MEFLVPDHFHTYPRKIDYFTTNHEITGYFFPIIAERVLSRRESRKRKE